MENKVNEENQANLNENNEAEQTDSLNEAEQRHDENAELQEPNDDLTAKYNELNDKYLRLYSDFDNFRKRSLKERSEYLKTANEDVLKAILPVLDDFERAIKANENVSDISAIKEGMQLIYNKLKNTAQQKGLSTFESLGTPFDADLMEAITHISTPAEEQKGKVVDEIEKGYKLGDKVIRFAKVVVGS